MSPIGCSVSFAAECALTTVGIFFVAAVALLILFRIIEGVVLFIFARLYPVNCKQYGRWAVITGATDGIGKAYARELACRGVNIILISRNMDKLLSTSLELRDKYGVDVDIVQADFSEGWALHDYIQERLKDREIGILVNNVGTLEEEPRRFIRHKEDGFVRMININIGSVVIMTSIVLPQMVKRKKGAVVMVSSLSSEFVLPFVGCYGGTKAATKALSSSLYYEYKSSGIIFQTLIPSFVNTKMISYADRWDRFGPFVPDVGTYCRSAVATLGYGRLTTGYWLHELCLLAKLLPDWVCQYAIDFVASDRKCSQKRKKFD